MVSTSFEHNFGSYPYEEEFDDLIEAISQFETRANAKDTVETCRFELGYGWQAIFYEESSGIMRNIGKKLTDIQAGYTNYRSRPDYEWELRAPDGETYRRMRIDITPEEFDDIIEQHRP